MLGWTNNQRKLLHEIYTATGYPLMSSFTYGIFGLYIL